MEEEKESSFIDYTKFINLDKKDLDGIVLGLLYSINSNSFTAEREFTFVKNMRSKRFCSSFDDDSFAKKEKSEIYKYDFLKPKTLFSIINNILNNNIIEDDTKIVFLIDLAAKNILKKNIGLVKIKKTLFSANGKDVLQEINDYFDCSKKAIEEYFEIFCKKVEIPKEYVNVEFLINEEFDFLKSMSQNKELFEKEIDNLIKTKDSLTIVCKEKMANLFYIEKKEYEKKEEVIWDIIEMSMTCEQYNKNFFRKRKNE